jgi:hypothetical protein
MSLFVMYTAILNQNKTVRFKVTPKTTTDRVKSEPASRGPLSTRNLPQTLPSQPPDSPSCELTGAQSRSRM